MVGGSADLTGSNNTFVKGMKPFDAPDYAGRYVHYGMREFGMAAAMNGMALHGGVIPYSSTFLAFADYSRPAIRLGALMEARVIHVMTHDSIGLGEDGPTHQPVEHVASLRAIPNLLVFRPADAVETAECWKIALQSQAHPVGDVPVAPEGPRRARRPRREPVGQGRLRAAGRRGRRGGGSTIFASGTRVRWSPWRPATSCKARASRPAWSPTPCWELFEQQDAAYKAAVIGTAPVRVAVEAAVRMGWDRFIGVDGEFVGMTASGPAALHERLCKEFGITAEAVAAAAA